MSGKNIIQLSLKFKTDLQKNILCVTTAEVEI